MIIAMSLAGAAGLRAQFIWTGAGANNNVSNSTNWQGGVAPTGAGGEDLVFSAIGSYSPTLSGAFSVRNITVSANPGYYYLSGPGPLTLTGDITTQLGTSPFFVFSIPVTFSAGTHNISTGSTEVGGSDIYLYGDVSGTGNLVKFGNAGLIFDHSGSANTFSGSIDLREGRIIVHGDGVLGTGLLMMNGGVIYADDSYNDSHTSVLPNNLSLSSSSSFGNSFGGSGSLTFTGTATAQSGLYSNQAYIYTYGLGLLTLNNVAETDAGTQFVFDGGGTTRISGTASYTGGTVVQAGSVLIFGGAVPTTGSLVPYYDGYVGTEQSTSVQTNFIDRIDSEATGIIGFDTPNLASPITVSEPIDMTATSGSVRLGTATAAILTGTITPSESATDYQFGGRGTLTVTSSLTGTYGLVASDGLLLYVNGSNSYTGSTLATNGGAIVFNSAGAISEGTVGAVSSDSNGYIGYTENTGLTVAGFVNMLDVGSTRGVVGIDAANPVAGRTVSDAIDLSAFGSDVFLGTATNVTLTGLITPSAFGNVFNLTGFRNGQLTINSVLSGGDTSVVIGLEGDYIHNPAPVGVVFDPSVTLNAANTYDGGTTLQSGRLILGDSNALGTGTLSINSYTDAPPTLSTNTAGLDIPNQVDVYSVRNFQIGGAFDFTLSGDFINGGESTITKIGTNTLTLSGDNTWLDASIDIKSGKVVFATDTAAGQGELSLHNFDGLNDAQAIFTSSAPTIYGLYGESSTTLDLGPGTLTLFQDTDHPFDGKIIGAGSLVKDGSAALTLTGANTYAGSTTVKNGDLIVKGGSITHPSADMVVGDALYDSGTLEISAGGSVTSLNGVVGNASGSAGSVTVDGAGSAWNISNNLTFAASGASDLTITHGGHISAFGSFLGDSGTAYATVSGAGSLWATTDEIIVGAFSNAGHGYLTIDSGASVTAGRGSIGYVGNGDVIVNGAGSSWTNAGYLYVGSSGGNAHLTILNGASVTSNSAEIGLNSASGYVAMRGAGSLWTVAGNVNVGDNSGTGTLFVYDNAKIIVGSGSGTITLGAATGSSGTLIIGESEYSSFGGIIDASTITSGSGVAQVQFDTGASKVSPYYLTNDGTAGGTALQISGTTKVVNYSGYNVLAGNNTYSGGTMLFGGTLVAGNNNALGTGLITFGGGRLSIATGVTLTAPLDLSGGGTLGGNGSFGSAITVGSGVHLAPGNSVGLLTFNSGTTWGPSGNFDIEIQSANGTRGVGYDAINVTGGLTFNATLGSPFVLNLISLDVSGNPGAVSDFNSGNGYAWLIAQTDGITGFNAANIQIVTTNFTNTLGVGAFNVSTVGNNIYLNFSPVPEPSTYALLGLGLSLGLLRYLRRRA